MVGYSKFSRRAFLAASGAGYCARAAAAKGQMSEGKEIVVVSGAVAGEPDDAARAGAEILAAGGTAMEAVAATCLASGAIQPETADIGGYVLCAVVLEGSGRIWSLDANSVAPAAASERMYEVGPRGAQTTGINAVEYACSVKDDANVYGPLAVGVPGVMAGIGALWEKWGRLKWPRIVAPALRLLSDGFPYRSTAGAIAQQESAIRKFEPTLRQLMPQGRVPTAEDRWTRPELAKTLQRISSTGWRDFYEGEIGRKIADYIASTGGILTRQDMASFKPRATETYSTKYRNATVHAAKLPNGGLSCLQILNMLDGFESLPDSDPMYWHRLAEVLKVAWRDRLRHFGDPEFAKVPVERFLSKEYAASSSEVLRRSPEHVDRQAGAPGGAQPETVHIAAGDKHGNVVAATFSHGAYFGSCVTVPGTGIILGHGMCRFDPHPGLPNSVGPRKRPLNNVSPMIVRLPDRDVALGLRGGRRIVSVSSQLAQRVVDFGATARQAATAPRMHLVGYEPVEVSDFTPSAIVEKLAAMGHEVRKIPNVGGHAHLVELLRNQGKIRGGGSVWAAGVE